MVLGAVDEDGLAINFLEGDGDVCMKARTSFRVFEELDAMLGAEDYVKDDAGEGLWHAPFLSGLEGAHGFR